MTKRLSMTRKDVPPDAVGGEEEIHIFIEGALKTGGYVVKRVSLELKLRIHHGESEYKL